MNVQTLGEATCMAGQTRHGPRCGAPAVVAHTLRNGQIFTECSEHALASVRRVSAQRAAAPPATAISLGARVRLTHAGIVKTGRVLSVGRGGVRVAVLHAGAVAILVRALTDVEQLPPADVPQ